MDAHIHPQTPTQHTILYTNVRLSQFLCTVRTYSDTNATRYPQFQYYIINILVDRPGFPLPVSVQSSFGFLTTRLDTQHRFDACLKHYQVLCTGGSILSPPALTDYLTAVHTHVSGFTVPLCNAYLKAVGRREDTFPVPWSSYISQRPGRSRYSVSSKIYIRTSSSLSCLLGRRRRWTSTPKAVEPGARGSFS